MVPERRRQKLFVIGGGGGGGGGLKGGYMVDTGRGRSLVRLGKYWWAGVGGCWSLLGSLRSRRLTTLTNRLDRRGDLFLEWASAVFGDGERRGSGELLEDNSSSAGYRPVQRPPCLGRDGKKEMEGEALAIARPGRPPTGFADARFLP